MAVVRNRQPTARDDCSGGDYDFLINMGKQKYAWITALPMCFVGVTTLTAGVLSIKNIFWPLTSKPGQVFTGYLDTVLMSIFIAGVILVVFDAVRRWIAVLTALPRRWRLSVLHLPSKVK